MESKEPKIEEEQPAVDNKDALDFLTKNVYVKSVETLEDGVKVEGYDLNKGLDYENIFKTYIHTGF